MSRVERLAAADQEAFEAACHLAFHEIANPADIAMDQRVTDPARTFGVRECGAIVATGANLLRELTIPDGAVPMAGVSAIGVVPGHTRRGHLSAMMRALLDDAREHGEPVTGLWASEGAIYGRYGFGLATRAMRYDVQLDRVSLRRDAPLPATPVEVLETTAALERIRAVHERVRAGRPGMLDRPGAWWDRRTYDPEHRRDGAGPLRTVIQPGAAGDEGYALFAAKGEWDDHGPSGSVTVRELVAETPEAAAGLWRFLLAIDLVRTLRWRLAPDHDAFPHVIAGNDAIDRRAGDGLFVRLLDVEAALSARSYSIDHDLVFELDDAFEPACAGRYRLHQGRCERTGAEPDLALGAEALGAVYLGGTPLTALAAAGRVRELRPGAVAEASVVFRGSVEPWCPEIF